MNVQNIKISDIIVRDRYRKDKGDIQSLANDIRDIGLTNPITVDENMRLIAGERRLLAMTMNGEKVIPANIATLVEDGDRYKIEFSENENRKSFTTSEMVDLLKTITPKQGGTNAHNKRGRGSIEPLHDTKDERKEKLAKAVGFSSKNEAKRAQRVQSSTIQGIRDLVDEGKIAISTAADKITILTEPEQQKIVDFVEAGGSGREWKKALYHERIFKYLKNGDIDRDQADGYQQVIDSGKKTPARVEERIKMVTKHSRIGKTRREIEVKIKKRKEEQELTKWHDVQLSDTNYNESARHIIKFFGYENYKTLLYSLQKARKELSEESKGDDE